MINWSKINTHLRAAGKAISSDPPAARTVYCDDDQITHLRSVAKCGHGALVGVDPSGTRVMLMPMRCKTWSCPHCAPNLRRTWIERFRRGHPKREMTLTVRPTPDQDAYHQAIRLKTAWEKLVKRIRRAYGPYEYALVWELTQQGTPHCHVLSRGKYIPQSWLKQTWHELTGAEIVWIRAVRNDTLHAAHACKYLGKACGQTADAIRPLRVIQCSAHYYTDPQKKPEPETTRGWSWAWIKEDPADVLTTLTNTLRPHTTTRWSDATTLIEYDGYNPVVRLEYEPGRWGEIAHVCVDPFDQDYYPDKEDSHDAL